MGGASEEPSSLLDWVTGLASDPALRTRFAAEPRSVLDEQGLSDLPPADLHHSLPLVTDSVAARLGTDVPMPSVDATLVQLDGEDPVAALVRQFGAVTDTVVAAVEVPEPADPGDGPDDAPSAVAEPGGLDDPGGLDGFDDPVGLDDDVHDTHDTHDTHDLDDVRDTHAGHLGDDDIGPTPTNVLFPAFGATSGGPDHELEDGADDPSSPLDEQPDPPDRLDTAETAPPEPDPHLDPGETVDLDDGTDPDPDPDPHPDDLAP